MADPTLLLIHGLGATAGVWHDLVEAIDWPGRIATPDLAGHGSADWTGDYTVGALAAVVAGECVKDEPVIVVGHSLGGGVGLCLASGFFRPVVHGVVALGVKATWTDADVDGMAKSPPRASGGARPGTKPSNGSCETLASQALLVQNIQRSPTRWSRANKGGG